ncbi:MAG TPA: DUF3592 domain-containing protein [Vicinamibacterales bacterium]|nr:DUF3592 domain-containing protein [Vicinamibacterales bacterium]
MTFLWILLVFLLLFAAAIALTLRVAVKWGHEALELKHYGVEAAGRVIEKRQTRQRGNTSTWIRYEYVDQFGRTHRSRRNLVTPDAWDAHTEGGPIAVIYSQRHPKISLPKYLMDLGTAASSDAPPRR